MVKPGVFISAIALFSISAAAQSSPEAEFRLALPDHKGQLEWSAPGFKIIQSSAKPNGREIGIRGQGESGRLYFLGFLFLFPEQSPLTSAKCRDEVLRPEKKNNPTLKITEMFETPRSGGPPVASATYTSKARDSSTAYMRRSFIASGDICGDLELYSNSPINPESSVVKKVLLSYQFNQDYVPKFNDVFTYAQVLYNTRQYEAAAPMLESALAGLVRDGGQNQKPAKRVMIDEAGMAYGIAGDLVKARSILQKAIAEDPDYPLYYYNLACADAAENKLADAKVHLREAFARKANVIPGESMPDPTRDDSFLPYRDNKDFWTFLETLRGAH